MPASDGCRAGVRVQGSTLIAFFALDASLGNTMHDKKKMVRKKLLH
jgi:hypothetical protein